MEYFIVNKILFNIILINMQLITTNKNIYKIPFGLFNQKTIRNNSKGMIHDIFYNSIYVNLSIGTPPQIVPFCLNINSQTFSISNFDFNMNHSSSYESTSKGEDSYENEEVIYGFNSKDVLNINNNSKQKINFILGTKYKNKNKILGIIGLMIPKKIQYNVYSFFDSLRIGGFINSCSWSLKYFDNISLFDTIVYDSKNNNKNIIGEFIFGDEPHNYEKDKEKYNKTEFYKISPFPYDGDLYWDIEFNSVFLSFKENKKNTNTKIYIQGDNKMAEIIPNNMFIYGPNELFDSLKKNFFNKYFENNICREKKINNNFNYYIECDYDSPFNILSFPDICMEHKGFEAVFNLTYKDLFIIDKNNNKYIFLIFNQKFFSGWVLGSIFLRKYQFVFNEDFKTIGFYKSKTYLDYKNNANLSYRANNVKIIKYIFIFLFLIILSFSFIFFGMIIQRKIFNKSRRIRANELEDNFSYDSKFINDRKNNNINNSRIYEISEQKYYSI